MLTIGGSGKGQLPLQIVCGWCERSLKKSKPKDFFGQLAAHIRDTHTAWLTKGDAPGYYIWKKDHLQYLN